MNSFKISQQISQKFKSQRTMQTLSVDIFNILRMN